MVMWLTGAVAKDAFTTPVSAIAGKVYQTHYSPNQLSVSVTVCDIVPHWRVPPVLGPRGRLRSAPSSLSSLIVRCTRLSTVRPSFPSRCCLLTPLSGTELPRHVTSAPSLRVSVSPLKTSFQPFLSGFLYCP